jgi:hypothetical protein
MFQIHGNHLHSKEPSRVEDGIAYEKLVGVSFYQDALSRVRRGSRSAWCMSRTTLTMKWAIRVDSRTGETLGYLPRRSWLKLEVHEKAAAARL